jgi:hypothetical protein
MGWGGTDPRPARSWMTEVPIRPFDFTTGLQVWRFAGGCLPDLKHRIDGTVPPSRHDLYPRGLRTKPWEQPCNGKPVFNDTGPGNRRLSREAPHHGRHREMRRGGKKRSPTGGGGRCISALSLARNTGAACANHGGLSRLEVV